MPERTYKCYGCKEKFPKSQLVSYASIRAKNPQNYSPNCLKEKQARESFSEKVCAIFGLKAPGPRIWTERKRLMDNYGYTDSVIVDCLDYIYKVEKKKKLAESLCLVNPTMVEKMMQYKRMEQNKNYSIIAAMQTQSQEYVVPISENTTKKDNKWDLDDWLDVD